MMVPAVVFVAAFVPMVLEAIRSRDHETALRRAGAAEPAGDVYALMQVAYPACFLVMVGEAWWRGAAPGRWFAAGVAVFVAAKALKYWAIASLGRRWTFRVLVFPGVPLVTSGPYRFVRHPNYLAVAGELVGAALMAQAPVAGAASVLGFGALIVVRMRIEERALGVRSQAHPERRASTPPPCSSN